MGIDVGLELLKKYQIPNAEANIVTGNQVIAEFLEYCGEAACYYGDNYLYGLLQLREKYISNPEYIDKLYAILAKYDYNIVYDIKLAIHELAFLSDPNCNKKKIEFLLRLPYIQDISYDSQGSFKIISDELGEFEFICAKYYFMKYCNSILDYMEYSLMKKVCHAHPERLAREMELEKLYTITSLCAFAFKGSFYHSYVYDAKKNVVIDLTLKSVIDKCAFDKIYTPKEIYRVINRDLQKEIRIADRNTEQSYLRYPVLRLALYKQFLQERKGNKFD